MAKILIVARSHWLANLFARHNDIRPKDFRYAGGPRSLEGLSGWTIVRVAGWRERRDWVRMDEMLEWARSHNNILDIQPEPIEKIDRSLLGL